MSARHVIGIDLGGTKTDVSVYDLSTYTEVAEKRFETHASETFDHVFSDLVDQISELKTPETVGVGIGVPGLVHQPDGTILTLPNIPGADNFPLQQKLSEATGLQVNVDNDANCFALAEAIVGNGKDKDVVVGITLGTGVGGGIVLNGKIFHGNTGFASEIGHMLLQPGQPPYETEDKRGDVEQFFSGTAMGKRCSAAKSPEDYLEGEVCSFMHKDIYKEVAWMCTNLIHVLDPSIIIFGGSAGHALEPHIGDIQNELLKWLLPKTPIPEIVVSHLDNTPTLGAALLCLR